MVNDYRKSHTKVNVALSGYNSPPLFLVTSAIQVEEAIVLDEALVTGLFPESHCYLHFPMSSTLHLFTFVMW